MSDLDIPVATLCECGCGQSAPLARRTDAKRGYRRGEPVRYIPGHNVVATPFWDRVESSGGPDACWPWTGNRNTEGYGGLTWNRRSARAHRVAYEQTNGPIPEGLLVCHRCDNPPCCNPAHLFLGSHLDNARDKVAKGRWRGGGGGTHQRPRGSGHAMAILTEDEVIEIRKRHRGGESQSALAREYGVNLSTVHLIVHRKNWKHLP